MAVSSEIQQGAIAELARRELGKRAGSNGSKGPGSVRRLDMLTDPASPLFKTLLAEKKPPALPLPSKLFEAAAVQTQLEKQ